MVTLYVQASAVSFRDNVDPRGALKSTLRSVVREIISFPGTKLHASQQLYSKAWHEKNRNSAEQRTEQRSNICEGFACLTYLNKAFLTMRVVGMCCRDVYLQVYSQHFDITNRLQVSLQVSQKVLDLSR